MLMTGYVKAYRDRFTHPLFKPTASSPFCRGYAWDWMVSRACWSATKYDVKGKSVALNRGQFIASPDEMAKAWGWSRSSTIRFLERLKTEHMIESETGHGKTLVTVCNYEKYQSDNPSTGHINGHSGGHKADTNRTAKEEGKERKKDLRKEEIDLSCSPEAEFEQIWPHYPKRVEKAAAKAEWIAARKSHSFEEIAEPLRAYCRGRKGQDPHFTISLGRWLKRERWTDEPSHALNRARSSTDDLAALGTISATDDLARLMGPQLKLVTR